MKKFVQPFNLLLSTCLLMALFFISIGCAAPIMDSAQESGKSLTDRSRSLSQKKAAAQPGFYIKGTKLYDVNGNEFIMRGVNHAHTWYKNELNTALAGIKARNANTVRVVLSNGTHPDWGNGCKDDITSVRNIIQRCKDEKLIAVLEVHDGTGSDDYARLDSILDYWIEMKAALIGEEENVIINIANEWFGTWNGTGWADGYKKAIPKLRNAGLKHTLIVDSAGWGQYPASVHDYGQSVLAADSLGNTMFAIHMYEYAGGNAQMIRDNIDKTLAKNLALVIGEFGHKHSDGDVDEQEILDYCQKKNVGWLAWSWKGNSSNWAYLDLAQDWAGKTLSGWGNTAFNGKNGIEQTSIQCSVFGGSPVNRPPVVNAGPDQEITELSTTLNGSATDDGKPFGKLTIKWSKQSGPGTVSFDNPASVSSSVSFSREGLYELKLTADDGEKSSSDSVIIRIGSSHYTPINLPFDHNGKGEYYWIFDAASFTTSNNNINSWSTDKVTINGVDFTNQFVNIYNIPAPINGKYQIYYQASQSWGHIHIH